MMLAAYTFVRQTDRQTDRQTSITAPFFPVNITIRTKTIRTAERKFRCAGRVVFAL